MFKLILEQTIVMVFIVIPLMFVGAFIVLPIVLLFIPEDCEQLPRFARWFDNHDYHYPGQSGVNIDGLAGFPNYRKRNNLTKDSGFWHIWFVRIKWLGFRNPVNYFDYNMLGFHVNSPGMYFATLYEKGDRDVTEDRAGVHCALVRDCKSGKKYYTYYRVINLPKLLDRGILKDKVIRIRMGWKFTPGQYEPGHVYQWVYIPISLLSKY